LTKAFPACQKHLARIDFELKVGAVAKVVEVAGGAPLLTTENAGTVIENKRIVELPLNGRDFLQGAKRLPATTPVAEAQGG
jgi:hypothetical protein